MRDLDLAVFLIEVQVREVDLVRLQLQGGEEIVPVSLALQLSRAAALDTGAGTGRGRASDPNKFEASFCDTDDADLPVVRMLLELGLEDFLELVFPEAGSGGPVSRRVRHGGAGGDKFPHRWRFCEQREVGSEIVDFFPEIESREVCPVGFRGQAPLEKIISFPIDLIYCDQRRRTEHCSHDRRGNPGAKAVQPQERPEARSVRPEHQGASIRELG
jgi:hypothetical protein